MCTTQIHFTTYNTHLFFKDLVNIGPLFEDQQRQQAISMYLRSLKSGMINIAALQEVWWAHFAWRIYQDALRWKSYTVRYVANDQGYGLNPPGLVLLADSNCNFNTHAGWESYKGECGESPTGWDPQDWPVWKGRVDATCQFQCSEGHTHTIGLFTTHMPVAYGSYPQMVGCSFSQLANLVARWRSKYPSSAAFLLGDLNVDALSSKLLPDGNTGYKELVTDVLIAKARLTDAAVACVPDPGGSVVPTTNTLWQKFNNTTTGDPERIDYFLYANSTDGSMKVAVNSFDIITDGLTIQYEGNTYNCSDHYPVEIVATITATD